MLAVQLVTYISVVVAVVAMLVKVYRYATAPEHMRWELYPVPHEKGRADYGGSYLEELDWWSKPRHSDMVNEMKEMAAEIILLKGVFHHNRRVWRSSFPFHFGLYLCIGWLVLLLLGAMLQAFGIDVGATAGGLGSGIHYVTMALGYAGLILGGLGALGLFFWRMSDENQRPFNSPMEYFNLIFFVIVAAVTVVASALADPSFASLRAYVQAVVTFSTAPAMPALVVAEAVLLSLLILYIPLTRMSHFVAKYFLYHAVRWNDEPNVRGSKIEKRIAELLNQKVGWSGAHIQTGQTWGEVIKEPKK
jgi:nitrate reductase gamma subunit